MALFLQKPVFWNTNNYVRPSGARATSGYPKEHGYGHEEWNNSPRLRVLRGGHAYRAFHMEGIGNAPLDQNAGQTFVFMTASHDGVQQLVGVAANAVSLIDKKHRHQREALARQLSLEGLWAEAWDVPVVRLKHGNSLPKFRAHWRGDFQWIANWLCPEDCYWWLDEPVTLNPIALVGKNRLLNMYGSYTLLDHAAAARFMNAIPSGMRGSRWNRILEAIHIAPNTPASLEDAADPAAFVTDVLAEVMARRGQGRFREDLMTLWGRACAVTGLNCAAALRASHVKPWAKSRPKERLDPDNGLILSANLDALFDAGLITFEDDGQMRVSDAISPAQRSELGLPRPLRARPADKLRRYLQHHRDEEFQP